MYSFSSLKWDSAHKRRAGRRILAWRTASGSTLASTATRSGLSWRGSNSYSWLLTSIMWCTWQAYTPCRWWEASVGGLEPLGPQGLLCQGPPPLRPLSKLVVEQCIGKTLFLRYENTEPQHSKAQLSSAATEVKGEHQQFLVQGRGGWLQHFALSPPHHCEKNFPKFKLHLAVEFSVIACIAVFSSVIVTWCDTFQKQSEHLSTTTLTWLFCWNTILCYHTR